MTLVRSSAVRGAPATMLLLAGWLPRTPRIGEVWSSTSIAHDLRCTVQVKKSWRSKVYNYWTGHHRVQGTPYHVFENVMNIWILISMKNVIIFAYICARKSSCLKNSEHDVFLLQKKKLVSWDHSWLEVIAFCVRLHARRRAAEHTWYIHPRQLAVICRGEGLRIVVVNPCEVWWAAALRRT